MTFGELLGEISGIEVNEGQARRLRDLIGGRAILRGSVDEIRVQNAWSWEGMVQEGRSRIRAESGADRVLAICRDEFGDAKHETLIRLRDRLSVLLDREPAEVSPMSLQEFLTEWKALRSPNEPKLVAAAGTLSEQPSVTLRSKLFISYSHKDDKYLKELLTHLKPFERTVSIETWTDKDINPGTEWFVKIKQAMASAQAAILLVSPDFLASQFIHDHELTPLLEEAKKGTLRIFWIPVRASNYRSTPLNDVQAVIDPDKPLSEKGKWRDRAWVGISDRIKIEMGLTAS